MNEELLLLSWTGLFWATRRAGYPVIPRVFWVMSVIGSAMTLAYFSFSAKQDSVGVVQNLFPMFAASYSLWLDVRHGRRAARGVASHTLVVSERSPQCSA